MIDTGPTFQAPVGSRPGPAPVGGNPGFSSRHASPRGRHDEERPQRTYEMAEIFDGKKKNNGRRMSTLFNAALKCATQFATGIDNPSAVTDLYHCPTYESISRYLSYLFRHTEYLRTDGSLSLQEMHEDHKFRNRYNEGKQNIHSGFCHGRCILKEEIPEGFNLEEFSLYALNAYVPLVNAILFNDKGRFVIGFCEKWEKRQLPVEYRTIPDPENEFQMKDYHDHIPVPRDMVFIIGLYQAIPFSGICT